MTPPRCYCCGTAVGADAHADRELRVWCETCRAACTLVARATIARGDACPLLVRRAPRTIVDE